MKLYIKSIEQESSHEGNVGIWWFYNNRIIGEMCPVSQGVEDGSCIQFSKVDNHITKWESTIREQLPEAIDLIPKGYRSIERGRVVYNYRTQVYEITCSYKIASDDGAIKSIAEAFNIADLRYDVVPLRHYQMPEYTGNPTLDNFDYGD